MEGLRDIWGPEGPMREMRPLLLWVATALLSLATAGAPPYVPLAAAFVATLIVLTASGPSTSARIAFAVAFVPTAIPAHAPTAAWVIGAALVAVATLLDRPRESGESGLLRHLERARRRGEPVSVMVLRLPPARRSFVREVQRRLRAADSSRIVRGVVSDEIQVVMDGEELEAPAVEQRLGGAGVDGASFGWAHFPQDGGSLDVLLSTARERARGEAAGPVEATERHPASLTPSMVKVD